MADTPRAYVLDSFALLTQELRATLVTGDPEFRATEHILSVSWLPER